MSCYIDSDFGEICEQTDKKDYMPVSAGCACSECGTRLHFKDECEHVTLLFDGETMTHSTCIDCLSIRNHLYCSYIYGAILGDIFNGDQGDVDCIAGNLNELTPRGRKLVIAQVENYWDDTEEDE
ncbi:MAG: hypothetical protein GY800_09110 [Planctomycetes bacterium]|nr:hypothetical protein [Planctomycetota bacterium]